MGAAHQIPDRDQIPVLIVVALPKELAAIQAAMPRYSRIGVAGDPNLYAIGEFADPDENLAPRGVLVCQSGMEATALPRRLPMPSDRFLISNILSCAA
jgi:hypothetical protein